MMSVEYKGLDVVIDATDHTLVVTLAGELDIANVEIVRDLLEGFDGLQQREVVVELDRLELLSACGIGVLATTASRLEGVGSRLRVLGPRPLPQRLLHHFGLDWIISQDESIHSPRR